MIYGFRKQMMVTRKLLSQYTLRAFFVVLICAPLSHGLLPSPKWTRRTKIDSVTTSSNEKRFRLYSTTTSGEESSRRRLSVKNDLLELVKESPSNKASSRQLTRNILTKIEELVATSCPTPNAEVVESLAGNWDLVWTAQDQSSAEWRNNPFGSFINPLENQAYSNNPNNGVSGRSNPFLPRNIQDRLERMGIVQQIGSARSSQFVDLGKKRVRNVVKFQLSTLLKRSATLIVDIQFKANPNDARRIDVKFEACRILVPDIRPLKNVNIPLGIIGPTGWLTTEYIDDTVRITRGHKGSVFILSRTEATKRLDSTKT